MQKQLAGKYLTFKLAEEDYGIAILKVKEIIGMMPITPVPRTPDHVKGVINLRGKVIPVTSLRSTFDMPEVDDTDRTCIIVVEIEGQAGALPVGIVVDEVSEVANIRGEDIQDTPAFGTRVSTDCILGMANMEERVKILLDIDRILTRDEIQFLENAA